MAIDSRAKRASIASLGLAFLGASVTPSGTIAAADRQTIAHSYYGIAAGTGIVEIGATTQISGAYAASGTLTIEQLLGATSQIGAYSSSGVLTIEQELGATSQLGAYSSSGVLTVGDVAEEASTGGWFDYDSEMLRRKREEEKRQKQLEEAERLEGINRELAIEFRRLEAEEARRTELQRLTDLAERNQAEIISEREEIDLLIRRAVKLKTFSAQEHLERELRKMREEQQFLLLATEILVNQ